RIFFAFLLYNLPTNAIAVMILFMYPLDAHLIAIILMVIVIQVAYVFVFHYYIARFSLKLHRPARRLHQLLIRSNGEMMNFRFRLKVILYVQAFLTKNVYSVHYGNFGKITMVSFSKVTSMHIVQ